MGIIREEADRPGWYFLVKWTPEDGKPKDLHALSIVHVIYHDGSEGVNIRAYKVAWSRVDRFMVINHFSIARPHAGLVDPGDVHKGESLNDYTALVGRVTLTGPREDVEYVVRLLPDVDDPAIQQGTPENAKKYNHYFVRVPWSYIDIYRLLELFKVTDNAIGHAAKKLLVPGLRGNKATKQDIIEARDTLNRRIEMWDEDESVKDDML